MRYNNSAGYLEELSFEVIGRLHIDNCLESEVTGMDSSSSDAYRSWSDWKILEYMTDQFSDMCIPAAGLMPCCVKYGLSTCLDS